MASAVYVFNDVLDLERDRANPRTARRPLASGELPVWLAGLTGYALLIFAMLVSFTLGRACTVTIGLYCFLSLLYCLKLKHEPIADVMCIALGFVLRVVYGVYAVGVLPTAWIVTCMFFLALFLGLAKRRAELASLKTDSARSRPVLEKYQVGYLDILLAMSATMTILCYALFTVASHKNPTLIITVLPVVYCITHYLLHVMTRGGGQSPEEHLLNDRVLWAGVISWVALCVVIMYLDVHLFVEKAPWP
jgi:4-hydroxybenzoate polyprenyltransferase